MLIGYARTSTLEQEAGLEAQLRDLKANKVVWSNPGLQFSETYDVATASNSPNDPSVFLRSDINALDRLATEFARAVVGAMLEAF